MNRYCLRLLLFGSLLLLPAALCAAGKGSRTPQLRFEWGLQGGTTLWKYRDMSGHASVTGKLGWQAGISMAAVWDKWALQPEIRYAHHTLSVTEPGTKSVTVTSNAVEVPVLVSYRPASWIRLHAGPLLTVVDGCKYVAPDGFAVEAGHIRPTLGYTAGVQASLGRLITVSFRYSGCFAPVKTVLWGDTQLSLRSHALQLGVGFKFR